MLYPIKFFITDSKIAITNLIYKVLITNSQIRDNEFNN